MVGGGPFRLPPGAWTDDTSMALCYHQRKPHHYHSKRQNNYRLHRRETPIHGGRVALQAMDKPTIVEFRKIEIQE